MSFETLIHLYFRDNLYEIDLDGEGGQIFLRVLLNLIMHKYPAVVSGALQMLFRHFDQRQEVLQTFKQVQDFKVHTQFKPRFYQGAITCVHERRGELSAD